MNKQLGVLTFLATAATCLSGIAEESLAPIREAPRALRPGTMNLGTLVPDFSFVDINGNRGQLSDFGDQRSIVIAMTGTGCPLCKKYAPTLAEIEGRYADKGAAFIYINPNKSEDLDKLRGEMAEKGFQGSYIRDDSREICRMLAVQTTTEVFVLDQARTLVYRGAVDDQYGFGYALDAPRESYLINALDAVLGGQKPAVAATTSPGCEVFYPQDAVAAPQRVVTYHNRISRIIQRNCLECHRDGSVAPMPLTSFAEVSDYAGMIRNVVRRGVMPPWFAATEDAKSTSDGFTPDPLISHEHASLWANDRSLSDSEKTDLLAWVEAGAPEGNPDDAPLPRKFAKGWLIGQPDAVYSFPEPVKIKATGVLPYKNIVVETGLSEDKWVRSIEVVPGDRSVVHHVLVFVLPPGSGEGPSGRGGGVDYWGIYVPGNSTQIYPDGYARRLPKNSRLKFQMHYTTNGSETEDQTRIGVVFADEEPSFEVKTSSILNHEFRIPPGAANHRVDASITLPADVEILGYLPHHHLRGKACRYELTTASGDREVLLDVPRYDFNWQLFYQYAEPRKLSKGSRIDFIAWYDNSKENPANPDPTKEVGWGQQTYEEMHLGYIEYVKPIEDMAEDSDVARPGDMISRLDVNGDGKVTKAELRERMPTRVDAAMRLFERLDRNQDGKLDRAEVSALRRR